MPSDTPRTYGLHIYSPRGSDFRIEVEREIVRTYENGDANRVSASRVLRKLSAIAAQNLPGGPVTLANYGDLATLISACATQLAEEDIATAAAAAAAEAAKNSAP